MKPVKFNLHEGMTCLELKKELQGRTAGESGQRVQLLLNELDPAILKDVHGELLMDPTHPRFPHFEFKLLDEVRELALISLDTWSFASGQWGTQHRDIFAGINDEGFYFVHELRGVDISKFKTMEDLLNWVDRKDEGFCQRVQGDILMQYVIVRLSKEDTYETEFAYYGRFIDAVRIHKFLTQPQVLSLGDHQVFAEHSAITSRGHLFCMGKRVILQHLEHGIKEIPIPENTAILLAPQRPENLALYH